MSIDDIKAYIERSGITPEVKRYYDMPYKEMMAIFRAANGAFDIMLWSYQLGRARGYRAAKRGR